ncbi:hypothetical protein [Caballeronia sp. GAFFF1]|uniref:hypothetical protein n=1 Tax=Caballeronia sp. GAFFF1 TaxID=2921779 RepID=UPI0020279557|nr:hypothetical protein [Caballeronia sp. GAFFF1]
MPALPDHLQPVNPKPNSRKPGIDSLLRALALHYYDRFVNGALERGYDREFAESIFAQVQGVGEYAVPAMKPQSMRHRSDAPTRVRP